MSACEFGRCDGSGVISRCVEPMAGLSGFDSEPCSCVHTRPTLPMDAPPAECDVDSALSEQAECKTCKRPDGTVNHVTGCIFVGWGMGWQTCPDCEGTCKVAS